MSLDHFLKMYFSPKNKKLKESFSHCPDNYLILLPSFLPIYIPNSIVVYKNCSPKISLVKAIQLS